MMESMQFTVDESSRDMRLDKFLSDRFPERSRTYLQGLIEKGNVTVDEKIVKSNYKLKERENIVVAVPDAVTVGIEAEEIELDVLHEDKDLIVVNKPQGMVVHPASGVYSGTLVNALLSHCDDLSGINGEVRPGIVHRIDKDTSGVLVIAKNDFAHNKLSEQLKDHSMNRVYIALAEGVFKEDEGTIDAPLGRHPVERIKIAVLKEGRRAVTHYRVIERFKDTTLIECRLETGRTHQIRVHMAHIGHPLVGDPVYGYKKQKYKLEGQLLHAKVLGFIHPTGGTYVEYEAQLPKYFEKLLYILRKQTE